MKKIRLNWERLIGVDDFEANIEFLQENSGVYVWLLKGARERICYIGEAQCFYKRFVDHFCMHLGGKYTCYNINNDQVDFVKFLRDHYSNKTIDEINNGDRIYVPVLDTASSNAISFKKAFSDRGWHDIRYQFLHRMQFAFATIHDVQGNTPRKEIEGGLIYQLWESYKSMVDAELNRRDARSNHLPIGAISRYPKSEIMVEHQGSIAKMLPSEFTSITKIYPKG